MMGVCPGTLDRLKKGIAGVQAGSTNDGMATGSEGDLP